MLKFHSYENAIVIGLALAPIAARAAPVVEISQTMGKGGTAVGSTRIVVDGAGADRYDAVTSKTLDFWVTISGSTPDKADRFEGLSISAGGGSIQGGKPGAAKVYKLVVPYAPPRAANVENQWLAPVDVCNAELSRRDGATRNAYLKQGGFVSAPNAYGLRATSKWSLWPRGIGFKETYFRNFQSEARGNAVIECKPLDRPKVRTQTHTTGAPSPITPQKMQPTIKVATLRIEPAAKQVIGGQLCPTELRLIGHIETIRAFNGKTVFFGPGFLSPITVLSLADAGNRSFTGVYRLRWTGPATRLVAPGVTGPKSQMVNLKMNVAGADGKVLRSVPETVRVTCDPVKSKGLSDG